MSSIVYFDTRAATKKAALRKGLLRRFYDRLLEARLRQAETEIKRHSHLLPHELDQASWRVSARSEDSLPFVR